jgi:zinc finger BED domain-containing protein 1 (E3 SUMO-protein ligase ZBED1)
MQMRPQKSVLKLKNDMVTRWNSTNYICNRLCEVQESLAAAIAVCTVQWNHLLLKNGCLSKEVSVVLKPFDALTNEISAEMTVTVSKVKMVSRCLTTACYKTASGLTSNMAEDLKVQLTDGLQKRFGQSERNNILERATFLDPQFKKKSSISDICYTQVFSDIASAVASQVALSTAASQTSVSETTPADQTAQIPTGNDCE